MSLSSEDALRLNVLLATNVDALRIDENNMVVYGLQGDSEAKVPLNPNCRSDQYVKQVREFLSGHVLGSPGGYPVYLTRWTRMGQAKDESLSKLLLLGEPEAVVAVACAPGLTDELARRVWWIVQDPENARRMLESPVVARGKMGRELAEFLVEFLPFESEPDTILRTVRLVLQPGLIDSETRRLIWDKGRSRNVFRIGFLEMVPDDLPESRPARAEFSEHENALKVLAEQGNAVAALLRKTLDTPGQSFLQAARDILRKPANQEAVIALLEAVGGYFEAADPGHGSTRDLNLLSERAAAACDAPDDDAEAVLAAVPALRDELFAMMVLGQLDEQVVVPVFATTTAIGSLMRRKLEPITGHLFTQIDCLLGKAPR